MSTRRDSESDELPEETELETKGFHFTISPFKSTGDAEEDQEELLQDEVRVKAPEEVPWIDLLLEISMTTAFASLTDGTPILQVKDGVSYVCYFIFVWWIWVSQVAYNMRFRQADILHRIWMFLQLVAFAALAAFTKDFDITNGLVDDEAEQRDLAQALSLPGDVLNALKFRESRLPLLNAEGLSVVMMLSRVLLLLQYLMVFYHAKTIKRKSLLAHVASLAFSSLSYLGAFILLKTGNTDTAAAARKVATIKIILWYLPIVFEIGCHYWALHLSHFVRYSSNSISLRIGTAFLIILGAGLDKITGGFKSIVGNGGLRADGVPILFAASIIFISLFSLYFQTPGDSHRLGRKRLLTWFFAQFFFFSALIITLQGIATSVQFSNINAGIIKTSGSLNPLYEFLDKNPGVNLTASNFNETRRRLQNLGASLDIVVEYLNSYATIDGQPGQAGTLHRARLQLEAQVIATMLDTLEATPESEVLAINLDNFASVNASSDDGVTLLTDANMWRLKGDIVRDRGSSGLWLYPATGATVLALGLLPFVRGFRRDTRDWKIVIYRILVGFGTTLSGLFSIGSSKPIYDSTGRTTTCLMWRLIVMTPQLQLVLLALVMIFLLSAELGIVYWSMELYRLPKLTGNGVLFRGIGWPRSYATVRTNDMEMVSSPPVEEWQSRTPVYTDESYDPYRGVSGWSAGWGKV